MDALEDLLAHQGIQATERSRVLRLLENTEYSPADRSSIFEAIDYSPLQYAITFSPQNVASLLADGEDATTAPLLAYAVVNDASQVIKPLLDAGAQVNMKARQARNCTALHLACERCSYDGFSELLKWAGNDIDWNACTTDGKNALELFERGVSEGYAAAYSQSEIDVFRAELLAHMDLDENDVDGDDSKGIPGAFPEAV